MMRIAENTIVTIRYIMQNSRGDILENTLDGPAASYLHGGSGILKLLQAQLDGLFAGEKKRVFLFRGQEALPEDFIFDVRIEKVREALPEEIRLGYPLPGIAVECGPDCSCYY